MRRTALRTENDYEEDCCRQEVCPKFIDEARVQVDREITKYAMIFGTPEYKLWRGICQVCPNAVLPTKTFTDV